MKTRAWFGKVLLDRYKLIVGAFINSHRDNVYTAASNDSVRLSLKIRDNNLLHIALA